MFPAAYSKNASRQTSPIVWIAVVGIAVLVSSGGCGMSRMAELRSVPRSPLVDRLKLTAWGGPRPSDRTRQFLRVHDMDDALDGNPQALLVKVQAVVDQSPTAENIYSLAELAYLSGRKAELLDPRLAMDFYGMSAVHAYQYLFDQRFAGVRNPYDPQFRGACDLYNGALESALRIVSRKSKLTPGRTYTIQTAHGSWEIPCVLRGGHWREEDFDHFEFVSDYEVQGLPNHYRTYGLGVPLIAVRRRHEGEPAAAKYYPENLSFPVTALLRPDLNVDPRLANASGIHHAVLELYDPLAGTDVVLDGIRAPLESDLTTPMAYFLDDSRLGSLDTLGLLRPGALLEKTAGSKTPMAGLYMAQPYEPDKIPVVMVHGLWSSPMTWMNMFNDLRSSPEICRRYQFWFYLYPSGQPFWESAAGMRRDLAEVRQTLDPESRRPSIDQMVLIGHSMGGLVSRLQTLDSGADFWNLVSDQPFDRVQGEREEIDRLAETFFFRPDRSIRRVVTIGTPHRGSDFSNDYTRWFSRKVIRLPNLLQLTRRTLFDRNRDLIRDDSLLEIENSIDSLDPDSPFFPVMLTGHRAPWVQYHNIIGVVPPEGITGYLAGDGDGVVNRDSARMDDVRSEIIVPAQHTAIHSHPRAVLEVRRILLQHLDELDGNSVQTASFARP